MKRTITATICLMILTFVMCFPVFANEVEQPGGSWYFGIIDEAEILEVEELHIIAGKNIEIDTMYEYAICFYTGDFDTTDEFYDYVETIPTERLNTSEYDSGIVLGTGFIDGKYYYYSFPYGRYSDTINDAIFTKFEKFDEASETYLESYKEYINLVGEFLEKQTGTLDGVTQDAPQEPSEPIESKEWLFDAELIDEANLLSDKNKDYFERRIKHIYQTYNYKITLKTKDFNYAQSYPDYIDYSDELISQTKGDKSDTGSVIVFAPHAYKDFYFINSHYGEYREPMKDKMFSFYNIESYAREDEENIEDMCYYVLGSALDWIENVLVEENKPPIKPVEEFVGIGEMIDGFDPMIDAAELFSEAEEEQLFDRIEAIQDTYDFDVTIITMKEIPDDSYDLREYFDWYEGLDPTRDGLVVGVNMNEIYREFSISARNFGMEAFNDDAHWLIDKKVPPMLTAGEYVEAFNLFLDYTEEFLAGAKAGEPYKRPIDIYTVIIFVVALPLILAYVIAWAIVKFFFVRQMKTAVTKTQAKDFMKKDSLVLTVNSDVYSHETEKREYDPPSSSSGSSSGGGSRTESSGYGGSRSGSSSSF